MDTVQQQIEKAKKLILSEALPAAESLLSGVLEKEPGNSEARFELAKIFQIRGNDSLAEKGYGKVLEIDSSYYLANLELARIYYRQRLLDQALAQYRIFTSHISAGPEVFRELGRLCDDMGDPQAALGALETIVHSHPEDRELHLELGKIYREAGKDKESAGVFRKILALPGLEKDKFFYNKVLNELEITEKREFVESKLRAMIAMILDRCNIKCKICGIWKGRWQVRDSVLREIRELFPYMEDICWQGGEVFMMKGFDDVLEEGTGYPNLKQVIFTNGLLLNEKILEKLRKGRVDLVFSIDGVTKEVYEHIRSGGSFEKLTRVLGMIREFRKQYGRKLKIYFNPVIMKTNYTQLDDFIEFARRYEFDSVTFCPIRGEFGDENIFDLRNEKALGYIRKNMPGVLKRAREYGVRLNNWLPVECGPKHEAAPGSVKKISEPGPGKQGFQQKRDRMICYAPWQRLLLDCDGAVRPFAFCLKQFIGNTDTMSLAEIWNGEEIRRYRRKIAGGEYEDLCQPECISGQVRDKICKIE
ncbi:MAG TPA: radical SAM protein [bacterium]|nr:radical SAM protein [bacterium]